MTSPADYPRVLIVAANPINRVQSAGLMMRSLFQGWPKDRLAQVYFPFFHSFVPDALVCSQYLRVGQLGIAREQTYSEGTPGGGARNPASFGRLVHRLTRQRSLRAPLIDPLREALALYPWVDRQILRYARAFDPDVVYSLLGTLAITRTTARIATELDRPVAPHFTDHWIDSRFVGSPFGGYLRRGLSRWLNRVLERSPTIFTMSELMAEEYSRRFDKECHFLTTLVDKEPYLRAEREATPDTNRIRLLYAGSLGLGRAEILGLLGRVLQSLRTEGLTAVLHVYCSDEDTQTYGDAIRVPGVLEMKGWAPVSRLPEVFADAEVLVHVESSDPTLLRYTRYAFSTKLSQYMMAGRCLLLVGPSEAGSMREILRTESGVVAEPTSREQIESALRRILRDPSFRAAMGRKAREVALEQFDAERHRERFRMLLREIAAG